MTADSKDKCNKESSEERRLFTKIILYRQNENEIEEKPETIEIVIQADHIDGRQEKRKELAYRTYDNSGNPCYVINLPVRHHNIENGNKEVICFTAFPLGNEEFGSTHRSSSFTIDQAEKNTKEIIEKHYTRFLNKDNKAVIDILNINPLFIQLDWVANSVTSWIKAGNITQIKRIEKIYQKDIKLSIFVIVEALAREGMSKDKAFRELINRKIVDRAFGYETIKKYYYEAASSDKLKAFIIKNQDD